MNGPSGRELLARIPEELLDVPVEQMHGDTPRQAAEYLDECVREGQPYCPACRSVLMGMAS